MRLHQQKFIRGNVKRKQKPRNVFYRRSLHYTALKSSKATINCKHDIALVHGVVILLGVKKHLHLITF